MFENYKVYITFIINGMTKSNNKIFFQFLLMFIPAKLFPSHLSVPENAYLTMMLCVMTIHSVIYLILGFSLIMSVLEFRAKY